VSNSSLRRVGPPMPNIFSANPVAPPSRASAPACGEPLEKRISASCLAGLA
jgi:hypothetical protein